jgi:serine/threonine protein kinase
VFNNQYVVRKKLSSGSFGVVFLGEDKLTQAEVALKIEKEDSEETRSLDREVQTHYERRCIGALSLQAAGHRRHT